MSAAILLGFRQAFQQTYVSNWGELTLSFYYVESSNT
jgi:hypothetical protein